MKYKFKLVNGNIIRPFYNSNVGINEKHFGTMSWFEKDEQSNETEVYEKVYKDKKGNKYFMCHNEKVLVSDFLAYEPAELIRRMADKETYLAPEELIYTLMRYGIDSIHVMLYKEKMMGFEVGGAYFGFETHHFAGETEKLDEVEYKFTETDMFKLEDNYKIKVTPANEENIGVYASRDYYVYDLFSLMRTQPNTYRLIESKAA